MINIVILSDLHIEENNLLQQKILENIISHFDDQISDGKKFDLVLVAGDITTSGSKKEFEIASSFFKRLKATLQIQSQNFLFTPGNHDYSRHAIGTGFKYIGNLNTTTYQEIFNDKDFGTHVLKAFHNYLCFIKDFYGDEQSIYGYKKDFLIDDIPVYISVFNSCLSNTMANDHADAYIDMNLIEKMVHRKDENNLSIIMMHHPLDAFYIDNKRQIENFITDSVDLFIHGHDHLPDYAIISKQNEKSYIRITNGCAYLNEERNPENYFFRFSVLSYDPVINELTIQVWYTRKNQPFCSVDTSIDPSSKETGIIKLRLNGKISKYGTYQLMDPLEDEIPKELEQAFERNVEKILKIKNKEKLLSFRKRLNTSKLYPLKDLARYLLKYMINEDLIESYDELREMLDGIFVFQQIKTLHKRILDYYQSFFEEKKEDIITKISKRRKDLDVRRILKDLDAAKKEIEQLRKSHVSPLELYMDRPASLLPPILDEEEQDITESFDWYKEIGLKSDPFPSNDGLENIDENLFDKIIYPTQSIETFKRIILSEDLKDLKNKSIAIYGAFGAGKTTLFQYMIRLLKLHHKEVITIMLSLEARRSKEEISRKFFLKLRSKLREIHFKVFNYSPNTGDVEEDCILMLNKLSTVSNSLFIFIEDIYKHSGRGEYMNEVIGFIQSLQIYRKDFTDRGIPTSFFFSSLGEIVEKIKGDHSTSGSVDTYHRISPIKLDDALNMINRRLLAFSIDPTKPFKVERNYLEHLRRIEIQNGTPIKTFRDYIEILLKRFRRREFTIESISIQKDESIIRAVIRDLKTNHVELYNVFHELKRRAGLRRDIFVKFIRTLEDLWNKRPIIENEGEFFLKRTYLIHLVNLKLLKKISFEDKDAWTLSDDLNTYFNKISNQYRIYPSNILPSVFFTDEKSEQLENKVVVAIENILKRSEDYGLAFSNHLNIVKQRYSSLYELSQSIHIIEQDIIDDEKIKQIEDAFKSLIIAFVIQCDADVTDFETAEIYYEDSWYELQEATLFSKQLKAFRKKRFPSDDDKLQLLRDFLNTTKEVISLLKRFVQWDSLFSLKSKSIWKSDKIVLNNIRRNIENTNYDLAREKIISLLIKKLQGFVYDCCLVMFGYDKWRRGLPENINLKLKMLKEKIPPEDLVNEREFMLALDLPDLFATIEFLAIMKCEGKNVYINKINEMCKIIRSSITKENPWTREILDLIESVDCFYEVTIKSDSTLAHLMNEYPNKVSNNAPSYNPYQKISRISLDTPLLLDSELQLISIDEEPLNIIEFSLLVYQYKNEISVDFNYRKDEICINVK